MPWLLYCNYVESAVKFVDKASSVLAMRSILHRACFFDQQPLGGFRQIQGLFLIGNLAPADGDASSPSRR